MNLTIDRHQAAAWLGIHPDRMSDRLRVDGALRGCVANWGGHGKRQTFHVQRLVEYDLARRAPESLAQLTLERLEDVEAGAPAPAPRARRKR